MLIPFKRSVETVLAVKRVSTVDNATSFPSTNSPLEFSGSLKLEMNVIAALVSPLRQGKTGLAMHVFRFFRDFNDTSVPLLSTSNPVNNLFFGDLPNEV